MMKKHPKIYLVHAAEVAIPPIVSSFRAHWPEARIANLVDGALAALQENRPEEHNRLIAELAATQNGCDVIAFAQFSMAQAAALAATRTTKPILTTPDSAIAKLQTLLA
jgi:hypothetical protein